MFRYRTLVSCLLLALGPTLARAQDGFNAALWGLCPTDPLAQQLTPNTGADPRTSPTEFMSDAAESDPQQAVLEGSVDIRRGDQHLTADKAQLNRQTSVVTAQGQVRFGGPSIAVRSNSAEVNLDQERGQFNDADYYFSPRNAQGHASEVKSDRQSEKTELTQVSYSTCERGKEFWQLRSNSLELNEQSGRGEAWHVTLRLADIPVMYLPYISFPITDERQSGFLAPQIGLDEDNGFDLRVPYYWNIAPNQDATIAPRIISERGAQIGAEYRYLGENHRGEIDVEYMPDDQLFGDQRSAIFARHQSNFSPGLYSDLLLQNVSDDDYLRDLDNNLSMLNTTYLERRLDLRYLGEGWGAGLRLQNYQTLDEALFSTEEPYSRLPQLMLQGQQDLGQGVNLRLLSEWVYFDHPDRVKGSRLDLYPTLSMPLENHWGFVTPSVGYRYTAYDLQRPDGDLQDEQPSRNLPVLSLDSGLFFERPVDWSWMGGSMTQTLEPRLYYLYVPYRNQDDLPVFDSAEVDRSYSWLFLDNRFVGADRVGDANQVTAAVTTRLINEDGRERARLSVGQVHHFDDPRVKLDANSKLDQGESELITEATIHMSPELTLRGALQWDAELDQTQRAAMDVRYQHGQERIVNVSYRFADDVLEQTDLAMLWRINPQWMALGRWNYSLEEQHNVDLFAGFEYGDCCWALRVLGRQHRLEPDDADAKNSLYLELELKGLTSIGNKTGSLLENAIYGYQRTRY